MILKNVENNMIQDKKNLNLIALYDYKIKDSMFKVANIDDLQYVSNPWFESKFDRKIFVKEK